MVISSFFLGGVIYTAAHSLGGELTMMDSDGGLFGHAGGGW